MSVPFKPRACHRALSAFIAKAAPNPKIQAIVASVGIRRLVGRVMNVIGQEMPGDTHADSLSIQVARQAWFSDINVIMSIAQAIAKTMKVPELLAPAQIFLAAAHGQEEAAANDMLVQNGTAALCAAFAKAKVVETGEELDTRAIVLTMLSVSNTMLALDLHESLGLPLETAYKTCDGSMTIAEVLNKYPQVILLSVGPKQPKRTASTSKKGSKPAK